MGQAPPIFEKMEGKVNTNVKINQVTENQALLGSEPRQGGTTVTLRTNRYSSCRPLMYQKQEHSYVFYT